MSLLVCEIIIIVVLAVTIFFLFFKKCLKKGMIISVIISILILVEAFLIIHLFFCYQWGFPASISQKNSQDLTLNSSDWLGFLGGYLSFAGSLVMAFLVYQQNQTISNLTISEYLPRTHIKVIKHLKIIDDDKNIIQSIPDDLTEKFYTFRCYCQVDDSGPENTSNLLLFTKIINESKSNIERLSFVSLDIAEICENGRLFEFSNIGKEWDPADKTFSILAGETIKRCFFIKNIPSEFDISWMTFHFSYGDNQTLEMKILVSNNNKHGFAVID